MDNSSKMKTEFMAQIKLTHKTYNWDPYKYTPKRKDRLTPRTLKNPKTLNMGDRPKK